MDEDRLAAAFTVWERQRREDPGAFVSANRREQMSPEDYGRRQARHLLRILDELRDQ